MWKMKTCDPDDEKKIQFEISEEEEEDKS